jgi:hypothetical protein
MEGHKNKGVAKWGPHKRMKRKNEDDGGQKKGMNARMGRIP